ncbi:bile acid:sodium symporter family protein [Alicyclobacillus fastidiosus]|uniref:Bile acid:sodium symporter family protein n=1 Tax=Alicyclobacillus fastidiosus TaxID=392011 RepID=A0ABY6ZEG4_9BACL|nr:bile acid:sodium symporter family protein [Alicyclobacillus fastidiosus]WAH41288.1 bile acid:sodium symporter family protein [Alicyclobacillus fastidiosus]
MTTWQNHWMLRGAVFVISRLMPIWIVLCAAAAFQFHSIFTPLGAVVGPGIGCVMFFMGITLDLARLKMLLKKPLTVVLGSAGKWVFAPVTGVTTAVIFCGLHTAIGSGIVMAGIVPSGTSANLNSLIGGGDVAYSVTMSAVDTLVGPFLTPLIAKLCIGTGVHLAYLPFVWKMVRLVFLPLLSGIALQSFIPTTRTYLTPFTPLLSAFALYGIVLGIVSGAFHVLSLNSDIIPLVALAVLLQVGVQMVIGYLYGRLLRVDDRSCRSLVFEVGICNSALAAVLAQDVFGSMAAVAAIANMVCNLTMGSMVAALMKGNLRIGKGRKRKERPQILSNGKEVRYGESLRK